MRNPEKLLRIGAGASFADDRIAPAVELAERGELDFVIERALGGGVTRSLAQDVHGKSLSSLMLTIELPGRDTAIASPGAARG